MKLFLFIFFLFFINPHTNAGTYYISPAGNDVTGNGTASNPWKTLYKATQAVTISGDIIHVNAGTYTETQQCNLAVGVSIEGDGAASIIKSTLTADWTAIIVATSNTEATNGNQHISNLYFDGQVAGTTGGTAWCIVMRGRKNFSIHDCTFVNFRQSACIFAGRTDNAGAAPTIFPTGNSFYNNTVNNCAEYNGSGQGCLMIGGQEGMLIYNNSISQTSRPIGYNGWPIKYYNDGYLNGCKIYNNILNKNPLGAGLGASDWDFAIELFRESGLEIYGNTITGGGIDLNYQSKGNYPYSVWIHDNNIKMTTLNIYLEHAITLEFESKDVIVENNTMDKFNTGIRFVPRNTDTVKNITIRKNLITNGGFGEGTGFHINFGGGTQTNYFNNIDVFNNTMVMDFANRTWFGIRLPDVSGGFIKNIHLKNNIIANSLSSGIIHAGGAVAIDSINIENNDSYNNGNNNNPVWNGPAPTHYTYTNNINTVPSFAANYTLPAGSPLIDAGVNVGLAFNGTAPDIGYAETGTVSSNTPPTANAGPDQNITLPVSTVSLTGSGNDPDGSIIAYAWTKISGPVSGILTNVTAAVTSVTSLVQGVYFFELKVTDNSGAIARDTMQLTVNAAPNIAPTANAGLDQNITLPTSTVNLTGSGNDPDGSISAYLWTKISGPAAGTITNATAAVTTATALVAGIYKFELKVTDNSGAVARDTMQVTVNPAPNVAPTANAGADQSITLPVNSSTLLGSGNDPDGSVAAYLWTKVSGPAAGTITNATAAVTSVTSLVQGVYLFELKVTDNSGAIARDTMQLTVNAANIAPTANAGLDQNITLPTSTVNLTGSGNDPDGSITAYLWTKVSGPAAGTITNAASAATTVTALVAGIYKFELKVTDNSGAVARDTMQVIVFAPNMPPVANAGLDQSITLPTNTAELIGSGSDIDGTIVSYKWTKISGPADGTILNAATAVTSVTGLTQGIYQFELKVTDNNGASVTDIMQVTVNAANIPPVANAGADQTVALPLNTAVLHGSGTDADGIVVAYKWRQISGPVDKLTSLTTPVTSLSSLIEGVYVFELAVTDNKNATDLDTTVVTVKAVTAPSFSSLKLYPNPVINSTNLEINTTTANTTVLIVIADMQGKVVQQKKLPISNYTINEKIDMSALSAGVYAITVYYNSQEKRTIMALKSN